MTLDIKKYLENLIEKEAVVSHFSVKVKAGRADKVKGHVAAQIKSEYGDSFLEDADYVLFFTRSEGWTSKDIKKLFELTDRALGNDANKLAKSDFMVLSSQSSSEDTAGSAGDDMPADDMPEDSSSASSTLFVKITVK